MVRGKRIKSLSRIFTVFMAFLLILLCMPQTPVYAYSNPTKAEIFDAMIEVGKKYNIPPEILYAVGNQESDLVQFYQDGKPNISFDGGIGIMQVTPGHVSQNFDVNKLTYDYKYNIDAGAQVLLSKWKYKDHNLIPKIGDQDPMVLENWYFAMWAYNNRSEENNPNCMPMYIARAGYTKIKAYQDSVIDRAKNELNINITKMNKDLIPKTGVPTTGTYPTPVPKHYSVISPKSNSNYNGDDYSSYISEFYYSDTNKDKVSTWNSLNGDGKKDVHFALTLNLPQTLNITSINLYSALRDGTKDGAYSWSSCVDKGSQPLLVLQSGRIVNSGYNSGLGEYTGTTKFDLYASDSSCIEKGDYYIVQINYADGRKSEKVACVNSNITDFVMSDKNSDNVGGINCYTPNGVKDGHFNVSMRIINPIEIKYIEMSRCDENGVTDGSYTWSTKNKNVYPLQAYINGNIINNSYVDSLGKYSGNVSFDLYADDTGLFKDGNYELVSVGLSDGSVISKEFLINSKIKCFELTDRYGDKVGEADNGVPDGIKDAGFDLTLNFASQTELKAIKMSLIDANGKFVNGGKWSTDDVKDNVLGVFLNGNQINKNHIASLGNYLGSYKFNLYANDENKFKNGDKVQVSAILGDGKVENELFIVNDANDSNVNLNNSNKVVIIDAGDGGKLSGVTANGIIEKNLNLDLAQRLKKLYEQNGIKVYMTRSSDTNVDATAGTNVNKELSARAAFINSVKPDFVISLHGNAADRTQANGIETIYSTSAQTNSSIRNLDFAQILQTELDKISSTKRKIVAKQDNTMLNNISSIGALVEVGFLTNKEEAQKLCTDSYKNILVQKIFNGTISAFKVIGKSNEAKPEISQFCLSSRSSDKVGRSKVNSGNGISDAEFKLDLNLPKQVGVKEINLMSLGKDGVADGRYSVSSSDSSKWILGIYNADKAINSGYADTIGSYSGSVSFKLYGDMQELLCNGQKVQAEVVLSDGSKLRKCIDISDGEATNDKVVVIDPGHGEMQVGMDNNGVVEKNLDLDIALKLKKILEGEGVKIYMTRSDDNNMVPNVGQDAKTELLERAKFINGINPDFVISLHADAADNSTAKGAEVLYNPSSLNSKIDNKTLAKLIQDKLNITTAAPRNTVVKDNNVLLNAIKTNGVIVDYGFITTPAEASKLSSDDYKTIIAKTINDGICDAFTNKGKPLSATANVTTIKEIKEFKLLNRTEDKIGKRDSGLPDGETDAKFGLELNLPLNTAIKTIRLYTVDQNGNKQGVYDFNTSDSAFWLLGIFKDGIQLNKNHVSTVGTYSGDVNFDMYADEATALKKGQKVLVEVTLGDGSKLTATSDITDGPVDNPQQPKPEPVVVQNPQPVVPPATTNKIVPAITLSRTLRLQTPMMHGDDVTAVQNRLNALGYNCGSADGWFGSATDKAVRNFQSAKGLDSDGIVGPLTLSALNSDAAATVPTPTQTTTTQPSLNITRTLKLQSPMMHGDDVVALQLKLNALGYNCGTADGWFGSATDKAVRNFQSAKGLDSDGIVGPLTLNALKDGSANTTPQPTQPQPTTQPTQTTSTSLGSRTLKLTDPMMHGDDVSQLQSRLNALGFNCGSVDGWFGAGTDSAVRSLQSARGLDCDGIVGPATVDSLLNNNTSAPAQPAPSGKVSGIVAIDPGHGGPEPGAEANGIIEKNLNLQISLGVRNLLESYNVKVYMTRNSDAYLDPYATWYGPELSARCNYINNIGGVNYVVSIHANCADATSARGIETLYNPSSSRGRMLAQLIQDSIISASGAVDRGIVGRPNLIILNSTTPPASLVEVGFISNYNEAAKLKTSSYRQTLINGIVNGIVKALQR